MKLAPCYKIGMRPSLITVALAATLLSEAARADGPKEKRGVVFVVEKSVAMRKQSKEITDVLTSQLPTLAKSMAVGVISYDTRAIVILPMGVQLSRFRRISIFDEQAAEESRVEVGLQSALDQLRKRGISSGQVVLLCSDCRTANDMVKLKRNWSKSKFRSVIIGIDRADRNSLAAIAEATNGQLYMVDAVASVEHIVRDLQ